MKKWLCVQVAHHKRVSKAIQDHQEKGWSLNTYQAVTQKEGLYHFLLFEQQTELIPE